MIYKNLGANTTLPIPEGLKVVEVSLEASDPCGCPFARVVAQGEGPLEMHLRGVMGWRETSEDAEANR